MGELVRFPTKREAMLTKQQLAEAYGGLSVSWVEKRMREGMPFEKLGSGAKAPVRFFLSKTDAWLEERRETGKEYRHAS